MPTPARSPRAALALLLGASLGASLGACQHTGADTTTNAAATVAETGAATASPATTASTGAAAHDTALEHYTLTMPDVERSVVGLSKLAAVARTNTALAPLLDIHRDTDFSASAARIDQAPAARKAVESAGVSTRDFARTFWAMFQAGPLEDSTAGRADRDARIRAAHVNPANVAFIHTHAKRIHELMDTIPGVGRPDRPGDRDGSP